jgi:hypothetical protein
VGGRPGGPPGAGGHPGNGPAANHPGGRPPGGPGPANRGGTPPGGYGPPAHGQPGASRPNGNTPHNGQPGGGRPGAPPYGGRPPGGPGPYGPPPGNPPGEHSPRQNQPPNAGTTRSQRQPDVSRHSDDVSRSPEDTTPKPATTAPGSKPETTQDGPPTDAKPGAKSDAPATDAKPDATKPDAAKPEPDKSNTDKADTDKPDTTKPDSDKADTDKSDDKAEPGNDKPISGEDSDGPRPDDSPPVDTPADDSDPGADPPISGKPDDGPPVDENGVPKNFLGTKQGEHPYADMGEYTPMGGDPSNGMGTYDQRAAPLIADHNPWGEHGSREEFNAHHRPDGTYRTNRWPDNDGAVRGSEREVSLPQGTVLDRFGGENGRFLSPMGTDGNPYHYRERAIFPDNAEVGYHVYVVNDPNGLPGTLADVAPALGQPGGGRQFTLNDDANVNRLIAEGVISEVHVPPSDGRVLPDSFGADRGDGTPNTDTVTVDDAKNHDGTDQHDQHDGTDQQDHHDQDDSDRHHDGDQDHDGTDDSSPSDDGTPPLPDHLQHVADDSGVRTPAGAALYDPSDARMRDAAAAVRPIDGHFVMDVHSDGHHAYVNGQQLNGADLHALARHMGWNGTDPIVLNGCEAGRHPDGLAADLARESGARVIAPTERSWSGQQNTTPYSASADHVDDHGRARPTIPPDGGWRAYDADGSSEPTGHNGLPVDAQDHDPGSHDTHDQHDPQGTPDDAPPPAPSHGPTPENFHDDADRGRIQSPFIPPRVDNPGNPTTINVDDSAANSANPNDPHRPLHDGERLIGRDGLTPNHEYHVPGRGTYYTNDQGVISHADLEVDNVRDGIKESGADANPDASYPEPNTTYRIDVDGAEHTYTTDDAGLPPRYQQWDPPAHNTTETFPVNRPGVDPNGPLSRPLAPGEALSDRTGWPPHTEVVHTTPNGTTRLYTGDIDPATGHARVEAIDTYSSPGPPDGRVAVADLNPELNNFPPHTTTRINGENVYVTNEHGVTTEATDERDYGPKAPRSQEAQDRVAAHGPHGTTDGGHIEPTQAEGAPDARNQFPQDSDENRPQKGQPARETWYGQDMEAAREQRRGTTHLHHDFQTEGSTPGHAARPTAVHERFVMQDRHGRIRLHFRRYDN